MFPLVLIGLAVICPAIVFLVAVIWTVRKDMTPEIEVRGDTNIPGPTKGVRWPILGDSFHFIGICNVEDSWRVMVNLWKMREKVMSIWVIKKLVIFVKDAKIAEALLATSKCNMKDSYFYGAFLRLSDGVFSRNGKGWTDLRRPLDKLMHPKLINENYYHVFVDKSSQLCEAMDGLVGKGLVDISDAFKCCSLDMVLETLLGYPGTQLKNNSFNIPKLTAEAMDLAFEKIMRPEMNVRWIYNTSDLAKKTDEVRKHLKPALFEIYDGRLKEWAKLGIRPEDPDFTPENYVDVVAQVTARENMPDDERIHSIYDMITAGFDTSSIAMVSCCLFLAMFPEYQEKAFEEQKTLMGDSLQAPTIEEISRMEYLPMVFNETLRHTSVPMVARTLNSEVEVEGNTFPEGSTLVFTLREIHESPRYYERPTEFYPDHFLPEKVAERPKSAFMPFSGGARKCPGKRFAHVSSMIVLSMLIRRFRFHTDMKIGDFQRKYVLMVESKNGYPIAVSRRT